MEPEQKRKYGLIAVLVLAAFGVGFSIYLLHVHLTVATSPGNSSACDINQQVSCSAVARSEQSMFLGVPVPVWGILTYLAFGVLAILGLKVKKAPLDSAGDYVLPIAAWSVLYSAYLAYVAAFVIKTLCIFCAALYAVNLGLLAAGLFSALPLRTYLPRRREDYRWLRSHPAAMGFVLGALAMAIGICIFLYFRDGKVPPISYSGVEIDVSGDPIEGAFRAPVTIIEFSDYECPGCRRMHPVIKTLLKEYPGSIRFIHKNFPLNSDCNPKMKFRMHEYACGAAAASECAAEMGRFSEVSERLWTTEDLSLPSLLRIASEEGLNSAVFQECLNSPETRNKLLTDVEDGIKLEITATPSFLINGYKFSGYTPIEDARKLIEDLLDDGELSPSSLPPPK